MRLPSANSPITQVQSPDPKAMGCEESWGGVPLTESTKAVTRRQPALHTSVFLDELLLLDSTFIKGMRCGTSSAGDRRSGVRTQHSSSAAAQARKHPVQPPRVQAAHRLQSSTSPHWRRCWQRRESDCVHSNLLSVPSVFVSIASRWVCPALQAWPPSHAAIRLSSSGLCLQDSRATRSSSRIPKTGLGSASTLNAIGSRPRH